MRLAMILRFRGVILGPVVSMTRWVKVGSNLDCAIVEDGMGQWALNGLREMGSHERKGIKDAQEVDDGI